MNGEEQDVAVGDETPDIISQANKKGWNAGIFDFGKAEKEGVEYFNPGLIRRPDGLWLLVRRSEATPGMWYGMNKIVAVKMEDGHRLSVGVPLNFPDSKGDEHFEDCRAVFWNNQTWAACVNFTWFQNSTWTGAHQMLGIFEDKSEDGMPEEQKWLSRWTPRARRDPIVGKNSGTSGPTHGKHEKNWVYFFHDDKLHLLYTSDPWLIVEFGSSWNQQTSHISEGVKWKYGLVRGGTPPVLVGDRYYTFFHSSLPWRGRYRRYYAGAIAFSSKPPFTPIEWTQEPLLIGSQNSHWKQRKPLVVFPCGAHHEQGKWLITYGINDVKSGWAEIPHDHLLQLLNPIPVSPGMALLSDPTERPDYPPVTVQDIQLNESIVESNTSVDETIKNQRRAAAAKARLVLAQKRAAGTLRKNPKRKKRRAIMRTKKVLLPKQNLQPVMN